MTAYAAFLIKADLPRRRSSQYSFNRRLAVRAVGKKAPV
jgi:hypothetical protein